MVLSVLFGVCSCLAALTIHTILVRVVTTVASKQLTVHSLVYRFANDSASAQAERSESRKQLEAVGATVGGSQAFGGYFFPNSMPSMDMHSDPDTLHGFLDTLNVSGATLDLPQ